MTTKPQKIKQLELLASEFVGDGKSPNLFFVSDQGINVMITREFIAAYSFWRTLVGERPLRECCLEDRKHGTICDVSPESDEPNAKLRIWDNSKMFKREEICYS